MAIEKDNTAALAPTSCAEADHECKQPTSSLISKSSLGFSSTTSVRASFGPPHHPNERVEQPAIQAIIDALSLSPHIEGGYFVLTDSSPILVPSPYPSTPLSEQTLALVGGPRAVFDPAFRSLSSSIFYYLTPNRPIGSFHRNRSRIFHTWHRGRGRYVLIQPDRRVDTFTVGPDIHRGEKLQWIVEGGVWKASHLVEPSNAEGSTLDSCHDLLISETVVPGFEYADHEFLSHHQCSEIVSEDRYNELQWLVRD